jgi:UDP-N-acetylmuramyl pentapeptide synthase
MKESFERNSPTTTARLFPNAAETVEEIGLLVHENDLILVKGSRGVGLEKIVEALQSIEEPD